MSDGLGDEVITDVASMVKVTNVPAKRKVSPVKVSRPTKKNAYGFQDASSLPENAFRYESKKIPHRLIEAFLAATHKLQFPRERKRIMGSFMPRDQLVQGLPGMKYRYSRVCVDAVPFTREVVDIMTFLFGQDPTEHSDMVLINRYVGPKDSVAPHSDDETDIDQAFPIVSVTIQADEATPRAFTIWKKSDRAQKWRIDLASGDVVTMLPGAQDEYEHAVPKVPAGRMSEFNDTDERFNMTFRKYKSV